MRHQKNTRKLSRTSQHRDAMLANLVVSLIRHNRVETTLAKARALRPFAEKIVTLGKKGQLHHRRLAVARIKQPTAVSRLFTEIAPRFAGRAGGYTRIIKLGPRLNDAAEMALIEWVDYTPSAPAPKAKKKNAGTEAAAAGKAKEAKA